MPKPISIPTTVRFVSRASAIDIAGFGPQPASRSRPFTPSSRASTTGPVSGRDRTGALPGSVSSARSSRSPSSTYSPLIASGSPPGRTRSTCSRCSVSARSSKAEMSGLGSGLVKTAHPVQRPAWVHVKRPSFAARSRWVSPFCACIIVAAVRGSTGHRHPRNT